MDNKRLENVANFLLMGYTIEEAALEWNRHPKTIKKNINKRYCYINSKSCALINDPYYMVIMRVINLGSSFEEAVTLFGAKDEKMLQKRVKALYMSNKEKYLFLYVKYKAYRYNCK